MWPTALRGKFPIPLGSSREVKHPGLLLLAGFYPAAPPVVLPRELGRVSEERNLIALGFC